MPRCLRLVRGQSGATGGLILGPMTFARNRSFVSQGKGQSEDTASVAFVLYADLHRERDVEACDGAESEKMPAEGMQVPAAHGITVKHVQKPCAERNKNEYQAKAYEAPRTCMLAALNVQPGNHDDIDDKVQGVV